MQALGVSGINGYAPEQMLVASGRPGSKRGNLQPKGDQALRGQGAQGLAKREEATETGRPLAPEPSEALKALEIVTQALKAADPWRAAQVHRPLPRIVAGLLAGGYV